MSVSKSHPEVLVHIEAFEGDTLIMSLDDSTMRITIFTVTEEIAE